MVRITLKGNALSTNNIYKHGGRVSYMSKNGKELKQSYIEQVTAQYKEAKLEGDLEVEVRLYFGDKRQRDWDNYHKLSFDSLSGVVWHDDVQVMKAIVWKKYDKQNPRIELIINKFNDTKK